MRFTYPQGLRKALTFSYDDGRVYDRRLVDILSRNGLKGTFHLNSGKLGKEGYVTAEEVPQLYAGHEVSCHGVEHRDLPLLARQQFAHELGDDRLALEKLTGKMVQGLSYAFGDWTDEAKDAARLYGIKYARTTRATKRFFAPADFLEWHPTCHHRDMFEMLDSFIKMPGYYELPLMYVWGHSYEFNDNGNWDTIETFAEMVAGKDDVWYATNLEICDYITATRAQEFSADGRIMRNPTALSVWVNAEQGLVEIRPGETVCVGK